MIVVGCGRVGSELAVALDQGGHSVAIIDRNARAFEKRIPEKWSGRTVVGSGFDRDVLEDAGVTEAEALAAVTNGDNTNILTARIARDNYEVSNVVARIYDPRRAVIYQRLGIPTVATVSWTVDQVVRRLLPDLVASDWTDATGAIILLERAVPEAWAGRRLSEIDQGTRYRVVTLTRGGTAQLVGPDQLGQEGDILHIAVRKDSVDDLAAHLAGDPRDLGANAL